MIKTLDQINREFIEENHLLTQKTLKEKGDLKVRADFYKPQGFKEIKRNEDNEEKLLKSVSSAGESICNNRKDFPVPVRVDVDNVLLCVKQGGVKTRASGERPVNKAVNLLIAAVIIFVVIFSEMLNSGMSKRMNFFGYSAFTVLSDSMHSVIPVGSLIVVKRTSPENIQLGDDITFMREKDDSVVTHRVIQIFHDFGEDGGFGFQTQGVENPDPDHDVVHHIDVIGVVKHIIPEFGTIMNYISVNIGIFFVAIGVVMILVIVFGKKKPETL